MKVDEENFKNVEPTPDEIKELDKKYELASKNLYQDLLANYESYIYEEVEPEFEDWKLDEVQKVVEELIEELKMISKNNSDVEEKALSILSNFELNTENARENFFDLSDAKKNIVTIKIYELYKQLVSDLKELKTSVEEDS